MEEMDYIKRTSLGQYGVLGELYDAYSNKLTNTNIFRNTLPTSLVQTAKNATERVEIKFVHGNSWAEKFKALQVDTSTQLDILCKHPSSSPLTGSGQFFNHPNQFRETKDRVTSHFSIVSSFPTKTQQFTLLDPDLIANINVDSIKHTKATHVVAKIQWGANAILNLKFDADTEDAVINDILARLKKARDRSKSGSVERKTDCSHDIYFSLYTDIPARKYRKTINEYLKFMHDIPDILQEDHNGLGIPLTFFLVPVNEIMKILKLSDSNHSLIVREISDDEVFHWVRYFDLVIKQSQFLKRLWKIVVLRGKHWLFVNDLDELANVVRVQSDLLGSYVDNQVKLSEAITEARKNGNFDNISKMKREVWLELNTVKRESNSMERHLNKTRFIEEIRKPAIDGSNSNSHYNFYTGDMPIPKRKNCSVLEVFVLLTCSEFKRSEHNFWEHLAFFVRLKEIKQRAEMWIVDLEKCPQLSFQRTRIVRIVVRDMEIFVYSEDYFYDTANTGLNFMYADRFDPMWKKPIRQAAFKIFCPRALEDYGCEMEEVSQHCENYPQQMEYDFNSYFHWGREEGARGCTCTPLACEKKSFRLKLSFLKSLFK